MQQIRVCCTDLGHTVAQPVPVVARPPPCQSLNTKPHQALSPEPEPITDWTRSHITLYEPESEMSAEIPADFWRCLPKTKWPMTIFVQGPMVAREPEPAMGALRRADALHAEANGYPGPNDITPQKPVAAPTRKTDGK